LGIVEVNNNNFEENVLKEKGKVLVDFNADWCGPCRMLGPTLEEIANERIDAKIVSVNIDENNELSDQYGILSIPCLVLFENGKEIKRCIGLKPKDEIESFIGE